MSGGTRRLPPRSTEDVLDGGRDRAPGRRRRAVALGGLGIVVAAAGLLLSNGLLSDGLPGGGEADVASVPPARTGPPGADAAAGTTPGSEDNIPDLIRIDRAGRLVSTPRARIVDRIENPLGVRPPRHSWAVIVRLDGEESWWLLESPPASRSVSTTPQRARFRTLAAWSAAEVASRSDPAAGSPAVSNLVRFVADSAELAPRNGAQILDQRAEPDLGSALAAEVDTTAVAEVRWRQRRWYVLARRAADGQTDYLPFVAAGTAADLAGFLALARRESTGAAGRR